MSTVSDDKIRRLVMLESEAIGLPKLLGNYLLWSADVLRQIIRLRERFFEIRIFRDMRYGLEQSITNLFSTLSAKRENATCDQDHGGSRFIKVTNLVDAGLPDWLGCTFVSTNVAFVP